VTRLHLSAVTACQSWKTFDARTRCRSKHWNFSVAKGLVESVDLHELTFPNVGGQSPQNPRGGSILSRSVPGSIGSNGAADASLQEQPL
jgi:hypothetical protein